MSKRDPQLLLITDRFSVAYDDDLESAVGRQPSETMCENYWEGCCVWDMTNGKLTSGVWMQEPPQPVEQQ